MSYKYLLLFVLLIIVYSAHGGTPKSNYDVLSELARESAQLTGKYLGERNIDTCGIKLSDHPAESLVRSAFVALKAQHFMTSEVKGTRIEVEIGDFAIRYFRYSESHDSLLREAQILTKGIVHRPNEPMAALPVCAKIHRDTIARTDVAIIENPGYSFTKAMVPEPEKGLLGEIAEPLVLFTVAAISVLLLFSIRSQ